MPSESFDLMGPIFRKMRDINITSIPLNPFEVIMENRWQLCTYYVFSHIMGMKVEKMKNEISPRAFSFYSFSKHTFYIVYNSDQLPEKITFNLAHEIGHILHGHISPVSPVMTREDENKLERDVMADQFARFVLQLP